MYKTKLITETVGYEFEKKVSDFLNGSEVKEIVNIKYSAVNGSNIDYTANPNIQTAVKHNTNSIIYTALIIYK